MIKSSLLLVAGLTLTSVCAAASDLVAFQQLTDRVLLVHFKDGHVEHHKRGEPRSAERVVVQPLDVAAASQPASYSLSSPNDPRYRTTGNPTKAARKSKGTDFAWFVDAWVDGRTINNRPDHAKEHWITLDLPEPLSPGKTYLLNTGNLARNGREWRLNYSVQAARSEAVHVNLLGYTPDAPAKFAYLFYWRGDGGSLDLRAYEGRDFRVVDTATGRTAFAGKVRFRMPKESQETGHKSDSPPHGNFLGADVWECDFSALRQPGRYVVAVDGIGCSFPFQIARDVYRQAFAAVTRALYHNRSGIALKRPYTAFERPAPHNPKLTPGFADKLRYTRVRWQEWGSEGGDAARLMADSPGILTNTWGWYQDAGDWDSYESHMRVPQELLLVYEMAPTKFADGELRIPESGNRVPDILDEAAWLPRFCQRLRTELRAKGWGSGGVGLRVAGDAFGSDEGTRPDGTKFGRGSWEDTDRVWMVSGEDPWSTYRYAGTAAVLAMALRTAGIQRDPEGVDWQREAEECYQWARRNTRPGDEERLGGSLRLARRYAAAALFRLTGNREYEQQFGADCADVQPTTLLWDDALYGPAVYLVGPSRAPRDAQIEARMRAAILATADELLAVARRRALRWGGNFYFPMLVGQQTTPLVLPAAVAHSLARVSEPSKARDYLSVLYTTCDYFLGTNALNMTWVTGLGPRYPTQVFHMDAWYNGKGAFHPGLIPYGPWRKEKEVGTGPWDQDWPNTTVHPPIDQWPGNERWFSNRCSPLTSEFTVHQNIGPAAAIFGYLCADQPRRAAPERGGRSAPPTPRRR